MGLWCILQPCLWANLSIFQLLLIYCHLKFFMTWEDFSRKVQPLKVLEAYRLRILSSDMMTLVKIYLVFNFLSLFRLQSVFRSSGCRVTATDLLLIWPWWGGNEDVHWSISRDRYLIFCWNTIAVSCFRPWSGYICTRLLIMMNLSHSSF